MIPLHKPPLGIMGGLDLKAFGQNPNELGSTVAPILDLMDHYAAANLRRFGTTLTNAGGSGVTNQNTALTVPQGQNWRVLAASISTAVPAADAANVLRGGIGVTAAVNPADTTLLFVDDMVGNNAFRLMATMPPRLFIPAGWKISFTVNYSAGPINSIVNTCEVLVQVFND